MFEIRHTIAGTSHEFKARRDAEKFISDHRLSFYEMWDKEKKQMIEFGRTPAPTGKKFVFPNSGIG